MPEMSEDAYLEHYGILRKSGRYPWGSGNNPNQRSRTFLDILKQHKEEGLTESEIAKLYDDKEKGFPFTTTDLRATKSRSVNIQKLEQIRQINKLAEKGMGNSEIARKMGLNESTIRSLRAAGRQEKLDILQETAEMLKREVAEKGFIDVGAQVERDLPIGDTPGIGISKDKFNTALSMLKEEGYQVHPLKIRQVGTGEYTNYKVLVPPGVSKHDVFMNRDNVQIIRQKTDDGGKSWKENGLQPPLSIDPKRIGINYKEQGGADADGVIYVRPGVKDVYLGKGNYAQVRIAVAGTHYLKGMAVYKDDLPPGVDLVFNTNKSDTGDKLDAMKPFKPIDREGNIDPKNPFGAAIKINGQIKDDKGNVTSVMNLINEEGDWDKWSKNLSRQVLSKQAPSLAQSQLNLTYENRTKEFEEIKSLTNPVIKRKLLESFAEDTDSSAVHLKAASMPKQATKVLLPVKSVKPTEIYAPTFRDGERVALIRFPHAGTFEIPELTVNNRNREARKLITPGARDAVGIHPKVAQHLSGADFDGDTVVVIPNNRKLIEKAPPLERLKNFDPQQYHVPKGPPTKEHPDGVPIIKDQHKQKKMGEVTNLIADMTVRGATTEDLANAVRHSMVVIDSEKHNLDYKASERDHGILALKKKYQGRIDEKGQLRTGAATLITRATARIDVPRRKARLTGEGGPIDPVTGERRWVPTGEMGPKGPRMFRSKRLAETNDAFTLLSDHGGTEIEKVYAHHSNRLKKLANDSRLEYLATKPPRYSPSAKKVYEKEVAELNAQLNIALKNAPLERRAQILANTIVSQRKQANPDMEKSEQKKIRGQALEEARLRTGAGKTRIKIEPRHWEAIQANAISTNKLEQILNNTDVDKLREMATPRENRVMTTTMTSRAKAMLSGGATPSEVAQALGIAVSTLTSSLDEEGA